MFDYLRKNPIIRFLVIAFALYLLWTILYEAVLSPKTGLDRSLSIMLVHSADALLSMLGYTAITNTSHVEITIMLEGSQNFGVWVGNNCNGISLFSLFAIYVIAFPGPWKKKLWYIPVGIVLIHLLNTVRIAALTIIERDSPEALDFNHNYTFTFIVYGFVFYLWYFWTVKLSGLKLKTNKTESTD